jgi:hypothetical protein
MISKSTNIALDAVNQRMAGMILRRFVGQTLR